MSDIERNRSGLRSRFRERDRYERRHPYNCSCDEHTRPKPTSDQEYRDRDPEKQHYPFLDLWIRDMVAEAEGLLRGNSVSVEVTNNGNALSSTPIVELFVQRAPDFLLRGGMGQVEPLYPHTTAIAEIEWSWWSLKPIGNSLSLSITAAERSRWVRFLTVVCYDPALDPKPQSPFVPQGQPDHHRKILTIPYWSDVNAQP